jgi:hypothetical protein
VTTQPGELFLVVTIGEALAGWSPKWSIGALKDLKDCALDIMRKISLDGPVLYGGRSGGPTPKALWRLDAARETPV